MLNFKNWDKMYLKNKQLRIFIPNITPCTLAILLLLMMSTFSAYAVVPDFTYVDEDIVDAIWTHDNSPYMITNNISILNSLYITQGVEVHFEGSYGIAVNPDAIFRATGGDVDAERIIFTSSSIIWQGLRFNSVNDTSILRNCDILNAATAINCIQSDIEITGCQIDARSIAINCNNSSPNIHHNPVIRVEGNSDVPANYSAISISDQSEPVILENDWIECHATYNSNAVGIQIWESSPRILGNWIEVSSSNEVCGIDADYSDEIDIQNNIIRVHTAPLTRGLEFEYSTAVQIFSNDILIIGSPINTTIGIRVNIGSNVTMINNIGFGSGEGVGLAVVRSANISQHSGYNLWYNFELTYSAGFDAIEHDIEANPIFVNEDNDPTIADYHLQFGSPCIDEGYPDEAWNDEWGTRSDIGCYSFQPLDIRAEHDLQLPVQFKVQPVYPNPFNSQTRLTFSLLSESPVKIAIYDIDGRLVELLGDANFFAGVHNITWKVKNRSTGLYILRLDVGGKSHSQRLIYLP